MGFKKVKFKPLSELAFLPKKATKGAAAMMYIHHQE